MPDVWSCVTLRESDIVWLLATPCLNAWPTVLDAQIIRAGPRWRTTVSPVGTTLLPSILSTRRAALLPSAHSPWRAALLSADADV